MRRLQRRQRILFAKPGSHRIAALGLTLLLGCTSAVEDESRKSASDSIINGKESTKDEDAVVLLTRFEGSAPKGTCTGTLVAPNLVLTARHCVSTKKSTGYCFEGKPKDGGWRVGEDRDPANVGVLLGADAADRSSTRERVDAWGSSLIVQGNDMCNQDVAFLILDRKLRGTVAPIRLDSRPRKGEKITAVGWGLTEKGTDATRRMRRSDIPVVTVGPDGYLGNAEFELGESICQGDSGGPALSEKGAVIGVVSRVGGGDKNTASAGDAAGCVGKKVGAIYTHLAGVRDLVDRAFAAVGARPRLEGTPDTTSRDDESDDEKAGAQDAGLMTDAPADATAGECALLSNCCAALEAAGILGTARQCWEIATGATQECFDARADYRTPNDYYDPPKACQ